MMFRKNDLDNDIAIINPWKEGKPLEILWKEDESWSDILKRYDLHGYDTFADFCDYEAEEMETEYPYSVIVYEFENHLLICKWDITEFSCLENTCVVEKNYFNLLEFYKEMCIPFMGIKDKYGQENGKSNSSDENSRTRYKSRKKIRKE